jgi:ATP-binding cassette subfamily C (CFTR/MRP) protein 10
LLVGCGKTSLLHAIMAEIGKISGQIQINAEVCSKGFGYVGQDGWIKAGSIKENILFGSELNQEFYNKVIEACALGPDLSILAHGDETFVGENGITLSGGQKTRLALARACYAADKDVYLFDDPLSAVDAHVAKHIYTKCIAGLLGHKTRIVSTHHVDYLVDADLVLVIEDGRVVRSGIGSELIPKLVSDSNSNFKLVKSTKVANTSFVNQETDENESDEAILIKQQNELNQAQIQRQEDEEKEHGVIHFQVYKYYCLAVGLCLTFLTLLTLLLMQGKVFILITMNINKLKCLRE